MSVTAIGFIGLFALFGLLFLRVPVAMAMLVVGFFGTAAKNGYTAALTALGTESFEISVTLTLTVIPLFVLMGNLAGVSGMSRDLFNAAYSWVGHWRGGLASATIAGCAGFAALSGSSIASAVTMGRVALPEMKRIIYAILTEQSIGRLFMAGIIPGILLTCLFLLAIAIVTKIKPEIGPVGPESSLVEKIKSLRRALAMVAIVVATIGGIYMGIFTPVEAAGVGALLAFCVALYRKSLDREKMTFVILQTLQTTATVFMILIGAHVFIPFMALTHIPADMVSFLVDLDVGKMGVILLILAVYIVLGTFLEGLAMLVLTLPITFEVITQLGLSPIWFGIAVVIVLEMGLISPPVGVNVFVVKSVAQDVPMGTIFRGIWPFWLAMGVCLAILVAFPQIATFLPDTMFGT